MYGGVSLAIYINGVAQELLNIVRATAPLTDDPDETRALFSDDDLTGAEKVYRKLGRYLRDNHEKLKHDKLDPTAPIKTRFVVDIISGTSAGGINGIFLAKALARNQTMDGLKKLWLSEGSLAKLLNDDRSIVDLDGFKITKPQRSLLNSQRMYRKLLEALNTMGANKPDIDHSPLVGELDLFVTTTDIRGVPLPIGLSDEVVYERRYKNVFHFRYASAEATGHPRDDFLKETDPFLAFAARSTSSFPFAFEATRLDDVGNLADGYKDYRDKSTSDEWDRFFSDYLRNSLFDLDRKARGDPATGKLPPGTNPDQAKEKLRSLFRERSFGDGGYLNNKPFSYATSMLMRRHADRAVARKLLYIEPSPEHPELIPTDQKPPPDFAQNVLAALLELPQQQTIRQDIDRLDERNQLLQRLAVLAKEVDQDIDAVRKLEKAKRFETQGLREMIGHYGVSYGAYHRLKVAELTALLTHLIARAAGHDPGSDAADAIRELVRSWRRAYYHPLLTDQRPADKRKDPEGHDKKTENQFLDTFDIRYELRRLGFISRRINQLAELDADAEELLKPVLEDADWPKNLTIDALRHSQSEDFRHELNRIKREEVSKSLKFVRSAEENLKSAKTVDGKKLYDAIGTLDIGWPDLEKILNCDPGAAREEQADKILFAANSNRATALSALALIIADGFKWTPTPVTNATNPSDATTAARVCVDHYRDNFLFYDLVTYPVQYGTDAGEANIVDVFRVSPEDAIAIVDQRRSNRRKLAGTYLMSFGAFLDESWRRNDMLWGRLDGAERLISALLPETKDEKIRDQLIREAHLSILAEEAKPNGLIDHRFERAAPEKIWNFYNKDFRVPDKITFEAAVQLASRGTNISGGMFGGLTQIEQFGILKFVAGCFATAGWIALKISKIASKLREIWRGLFS